MFPQKHILNILGYGFALIKKSRVLAFFAFLFLFALSLVNTYTRPFTTDPGTGSTVYAATSSTLNFQGRLLSSSGNIVPDGLYNLRFKIYNGGTQGGPAGVGESNAGTLLWTDERYDTNGVTAGNDFRIRIVNGYFSVNLGDTNNGGTAFPGTMNWDQELWLTMDVGGTAQTATPTYDGEMLAPSNKRTKLTAVPYAFKAESANSVTTNNTNAASTNSSNITIQSGNATGATSNSGNITLDVGTATGTTGTISIGTTNTSAITVGRAGVTTTLQGAISISGGTNYGVYYRDGSGNVVTTGAGTSGECFKANTGAAPTWGSCTGTGDFIQGGNAFSANAVLGTNDNFALEFETFGTTRAILQSDGDFEVDTNTLFVDATNNRVGIGTVAPSAQLHVSGAGGGNALLVVTDTTATARDVLTIADGGATTFRNQTDSSSALRVQNSAGTNILNIDSTNSQISLQGNNTDALDGSNLITSNDFSNATYWTCTGWTTSAFDATHNTGNTNSCSTTASNISITSGLTYWVKFNYVNNDPNSSVGLSLGGVSYASDTFDMASSGTFEALITATSTAGLSFNVGSSDDVTVSNVRVYQVTKSTSVLNVNNSNGTIGIEVRAGGAGQYNTFIGLEAGRSNSVYNSDGKNTALGAFSLQNNTYGFDNTASGVYSLQNNVSGFSNTATGVGAMRFNTTGYENSAFGKNSLNKNVDGQLNSAFGAFSLQDNVSGNYNTAIGHFALNSNQVGSSNTALGVGSLSSNTTGNGNIGIGSEALGNNVTGSYNLSIGYFAGFEDGSFGTSNNLQNSSAIGAYSQVQQSNSLVLGRSGTGSSTTKIGIGTTAPTDLFSISPAVYDTGTAGTGGASSTTVTGSGTTWTSDMVGMEIIFSNGTKATITAFGSTTSLTVTPAITVSNGTEYRIHNRAFYVTSTGSSAFRSSTNSTTSFQIQGASGSEIFTADTTNSRVYVGDTTADSTGTILVLDTKNTAGDPTGVDGATYYNSNLGKFRCYENGSWKDCDTNTAGTVTLQQAYANGSAGDQVVALSSTNDSIIFRNPSSGGTDGTGYILTLDQLSTGAVGGLNIQSAGSGNLFNVTDTTATSRDVFTIANGGGITVRSQTNTTTGFVVRNSDGTALFNVDTSNSRVQIGALTVGSGSGQLEVTPDSDTRAGIRINAYSAGYTGNYLDIRSFGATSADMLRLQSNGNLQIGGGNFGTFGQTATSTNSVNTLLTSGNVTGSTSNSGSVTVRSGTTSDGNTGSATLQSGNATGGTSGNVSVDTGTGSAGTGVVNIGTANASGITLGSTSNTTSLLLQGATSATYTLGTTTGTGTITLGRSTATNTINIGTAAGNGNTQTINIGTSATAGSTSNITIGSTIGSSATTLQSGTGRVNINSTNLQFTEVTGTRTFNVQGRTTNVAGTNLTIAAGAAGTGASAFTGGILTLQGGAAAGTGNADGGSVTIAGGAGVGTGTQGLVNLSTSAFTSAAVQTFASSASLTAGNVDLYSSLPVLTTASGVVVTVPDPAQSTIGRLLYIAARDNSIDFTLRLNSARTPIDINMKENSTATLIWNGTDWTAAGASSSTDLQAAYNNTIASAGGAELVLNAPGGNADGLTVRNNATTPITGGLLEVQTSIGSNLFTVNNNATEYATNGGAETPGASASTFPANTWDTTTGGTVDRWTTVGDNIATGQASVRVQTTAVANEGARNRISTSLTSGLTYTVSFAVRGATNFSTLQVLYSPDGTTSGTTQCATAQTVTSGQWTRITCSFVAAGTITSSNSILIRQTDATSRTFYIDNLSINVNASATYAIDGSVDLALGTNWTNFGTLDALSRETTIIYDTSGSVLVNTPNSADRGVRNNLPVVPATSTQYLVTFYARSSNTFNDIRVRYTRDGGTNFVSCVDYNTQVVSTTAFTEITCLFTTDSTTATDPDLVIDQPTGSDRIFYIDALSVTLNTNNSNNVQIGGANKGGPVTLFTLDRSAGAPIAANNEAYLGSMYYDTTTGRIQCYEADGWGACGAAPDNIVNLNPEYAGAVLNGTGVGTMTADFCSDDTALTVNAGLCETGEAKNYYRWTSPQATQQTYSIYVTYQLPATFNGFASDDTVQLVGRVDSTTNAEVTYQMFKSTGSAVTACGTETDVIAGGGDTANVWHSYGINGNEATGCSFTSSSAGDFIIFKINLKANSNANAYVSTLSFTTTGR